MQTLGAIECFVRSAEAGSFSEAARRLGLTAAAVSKNVARLEAGLGVRLFHRSTRQLSLSEAGELFLAEVRDGLMTIQSAVSNLASVDGQPAGALKVSMGASFGREYMVPLLGEFLRRHPMIVPDWHFDNRQVDLIAEGFDAAIGGGIELPPGVIARELSRASRVLVASPAYLRDKPPIQSPDDLSLHDGILIRSPQSGRIASQPLRDRSGEQAAIKLRLRTAMSDPEASCMAAAAGLGIALVAMPQALPYLERGVVTRVLPDWYVDAGSISIYFAAHRLLPAKTRAFVDFVVEQFRAQQLAQRFSPWPAD